ncbi:DUF4360 domain-containing protein [bacterium]|nr:DUF4360 domain-containing protein [bacterium]
MKALLTVAILALGLSAEAQIRLGVPAYGGTGCPAGTASVSLTDDQSILSVLFDAFVAQAPLNGASFDRKSCNLRIPVSVGPGYQVALIAFDYRGFAAIPNGGRGSFEARYAYVGQARPAIFRKNFAAGRADNYSLKNELISTSIDWTPCSTGRDLMMTVDANILAVTNSAQQATNVSIDSVDVSAGMLYAIQLRRCR